MAIQTKEFDKLTAFKIVSDYLELESYMVDKEILEMGVETLKDHIKNENPSVSFKSLHLLKFKVKK